METEGSLLCS